jgi:hypothetical protein
MKQAQLPYSRMYIGLVTVITIRSFIIYPVGHSQENKRASLENGHHQMVCHRNKTWQVLVGNIGKHIPYTIFLKNVFIYYVKSYILLCGTNITSYVHPN